MKIETVQEKTYYTKALFYGPIGVGKTTLAATFPNPVFLDWDRGTHTLKTQAGFESIRVAQPSNFSESAAFLEGVAKGKLDCETIVIDTMTMMQNRLLVQLALEANAKEPAKYDIDVNSQRDYNKATNAIWKALWAYRELPMNLVIIAHHKEETNEQTGQFTIRPDLTPRLSNILCGMMDVVGFYQMTNNPQKDGCTRQLIVAPTNKLVAKNRIGLASIIKDPTYQSFNGKATSART